MEVKPCIRFCMLCCYSFEPDLAEGFQAGSEAYLKFDKFCNRLYKFSLREKKFSKDSIFGGLNSLTEKVALCSECLLSINSAVDVMDNMEDVEARVYILQKELLEELRKLQDCMDSYQLKLKKVEDTVRNSDENCLAHVVEVEGGRKEEVDWLRKGILEVGANLESFRTGLGRKFKAQQQKGPSPRKKQKTRNPMETRRPRSHSRKTNVPPNVVEDVVVKPEIFSFADDDPDNVMESVGAPRYLNSDKDLDNDDDNNASPSENEDWEAGNDDSEDDNNDEDYADSSRPGKHKDSAVFPAKQVKKKKQQVKRKRKCSEFILTKLSREEFEETIKPYKESLRRMSKVKQSLIKTALRRKKVQEKLIQGDKQDDENNVGDEFWYRKEYKIEYFRDTETISVGGVGFIINDDHGLLQCAQCPFNVSFPEDRVNYKYETLRVKERQIYQHLLGHHLKAYLCGHCGRDCRTERSYLIHIKIHNESEACVCDVCGKPLSSPDSLKYHKVTHMNEEEKEEAKKLDISIEKRFSRFDNAPKKFTCPVCGKQFKASKDCRVHQLTHDKVRDTVVCPICGKSMLRRSYELYHMKYACPGREIARVPCSHCPLTFKNGRFLKLHFDRTHSEDAIKRVFQCEVCGKDFASKINLKVHRDLHNDKLEYSCQGCQKQFSVKRYWKRHEITCLGKGITRPSRRWREHERLSAAADGDMMDQGSSRSFSYNN